MRKLAVAILLSTSAAVSGAQAADLGAPIYKAPVAVAAPAATWNGFYVGVQGGYAWGRSDVSAGANSLLFQGSQKYDIDGGVFGGLVGWNFQAAGSPWVWGFEADINWANLTGHSGRITGNAFVDDTYRTRLEWYGTARGRLGYAWGGSLLYATGGLAYGAVRNRYVNVGILFPTDVATSGVRAGYTVGGGWEYAFAPRWTARIEYGYVNLGKQRLDVSPGFSPAFRNDFHLVKGGITYRFGDAPIVASY